MYVEFGATRACFVTKQGQESINRKIRNLENQNLRGHVDDVYERGNRIVKHLGIITTSLIEILQSSFDIVFRPFHIFLERVF